jgi:hypothetical protein
MTVTQVKANIWEDLEQYRVQDWDTSNKKREALW